MPRKKVPADQTEYLRGLCQEHTKVAVDLLVKACTEKVSPTQVRAAEAILAYGHGKPPQQDSITDPAGDMPDEELDNEMDKIRNGESDLPEE